ncbi:ankyrin [Annulohypoxylon maeteangense]|uniref:ankyrin n=1 Tax=Annulohypoxylon maeteangense TaxID=1927788 RepID=UPI002008DC4C|nr:ankyrin [Annulohypoxylon maeteangense]KAI0882303.1 ankyrin [Annulohypoxylon maeteangense]
MAEPLSIAASIAGLITLTDTVVLRLMKYVRSVKNAAKEVEELAKEINMLGGALHSLSTLAQCFGDENVDNRAFRMYHIEACNDILASIHKKLKKFDSDSLTKKAKWPFSSTRVAELLDELSKHKQSVNLALTAKSMDLLLRSLAREEDLQKTASELKADAQKTKEIVSRIDRNEEQSKVQSVFLKYNPQQNYETSLKLRHPRTGLWLIRLPSFQTWLSTPDEKLWLSGIPGAGKTVLAGTIIEASLGQCNESVAAAFFFCDYKANITHSPENILGALAYQIAIQKEEAYRILEQYHRDLNPMSGLPRNCTTGGLQRVIRDMVKLFNHVFLTVDGIDECVQQVEEVLDVLCAISEDSDNISMALLSRDEHNIRDRLEDNFVCEKVAAHTEDITEYVTARIEERMRIGKLRIDDLNLKGEIMQSLVDGAAGMFRWVACQLDHLEQCDSDQECREALKKLPPNLNETYLRILQRIPTNKMSLVQLILHSIAFAYPPLSIQRLRELISDPDTKGFLQSSGLVRENSIQRLCSSLIRKSNDGERFEFAHFSVQEFLENETILQDQFPQFLISKSRGNRLMAIRCLKYLQLENFNHTPEATEEGWSSRETKNRNNSLYPYAALRWDFHATNEWACEELIQLAKKFFSLEKTAFFNSWIVEFVAGWIDQDPITQDRIDNYIKIATQVSHKCFTPLHVACAMSLPVICSYLLEEGADVNQESPIGTPMQCAAGSLLSLMPGNDFKFRSNVGRYANNILIIETIRCLLVAGADRFHVASRFGRDKSPFELAVEVLAETGDFSVVTLLLSEGYALDQITCSSPTFSTLSRFFVDHNSISAVKEFITTLNLMIDFSPSNREICSKLWEIAVSRKLSFTSDPYLVDPSISLSPDIQKQHLLQAVQDGDTAKFERIHKACNLDTSDIFDKCGNGLLYNALQATVNNTLMIEKLIETGCSFIQPNMDGSLPIHAWLCRIPGFGEESPSDDLVEDLVKVLINHSLTACSRDDLGRNILHYGCIKPSFLSGFLEYDSEENITCALRAKDKDGYTPLSTALVQGDRKSVSLLFERCKSDPETWKGPTPIHVLAIQGGFEETFTKIYNLGTIYTEIEDDILTPLHYVGTKTSINFIQYLTSIYPNACDVRAKGKIPLEVYLEEVFNNQISDDNQTSEQILCTEAISALYPKQSQDNEKRLWEYFMNDIIHHARVDHIDRFRRFKYSSGPSSYFNRYDKRHVFTITIITELSRLGCLSSYETISQRSALLVLLQSIEGGFKNVDDMWPLTSQVICDIINHTSRWSQIQTSSLVIRLLVAAVRSMNYELVSLLCEKGVSVHQRVDCHSALEVACGVNIKYEIFLLLLNHADKDRLDETNLADGGLGLIHRLAVPNATRKIVELLQKGANPNLRIGIDQNSPALVYHLGKYEVESSITLLENGADPTHADKYGFDAYLEAAYQGATDFLEALYETVSSVWHINWEKFVCDRDIQDGRDLYLYGYNAFHLTAASGNVECLSFYIDRGIFSDVNLPTCDGITPLHIAARRGHMDAITFLHKNKANINARTESGDLPLHFAVQTQQLAIVKVLLSLGSDNTMNKSGATPFILACQLGSQPIISSFQTLRRQDIPHESNSHGGNAIFSSTKQQSSLNLGLEHAIRNGDITLCQRLHDQGCCLTANIPSCNGCSPLLLAIRNGKIDIIKWLLSHGASTLETTCSRCKMSSPICEILETEEFNEVLPQFLERYLNDGGNLVRETYSPVFAAVKYNNSEGLRILLDHLKKNAQHYSGLIGESGNTAILAAVNKPTYHSEKLPPLHEAVINGNLEAVRCLLENGADVNVSTESLTRPLHEAASSGVPDIETIMEVLMSYGAHIECRNGFGETPLMSACGEGHWDLAKLLLDIGADPQVLDYQSNNLLRELVVHSSEFEIRQLFINLRDLGVDPHHQNIDGVSAMHLAIRYDYFTSYILNDDSYEVQEMAPFPWDQYLPDEEDTSWLTSSFSMFRRKVPADKLLRIANPEPSRGHSPLCVSAHLGLLEIMANLLFLGAKLEFEGCPEGTALMAACYAGTSESVKFLVRRGAVLSYHGPNGFRTAFDKKRTPERILQWLLVTRFTDQAKIEKASDNDLPTEPVVLRSLSRPIKAEMVISGYLERDSDMSAEEYWIFLMGEKKRLRGQFIPLVDRRRTVHPLRLIPLEPVRIHPDGYEISKATGVSGV